MGVFGKFGKAGKQQQPSNVGGNPSGPQSGTNEIPAVPFRYGRNPIAWSMAMRLAHGTALTSPMVMGRFRPQDKGAATNRAVSGGSFGTPDLGRLQTFSGSFAGPRSVRLGAQAGASQQPGFPSTNQDSSVDFSGMGLPDIWRVNLL
jgi:hypothetical protein